jgi:hypothetical protein
MKNGNSDFAVNEFRFAPTTLVVQNDPTALFCPVVPILIELEKDLNSASLKNVQDTVVVGVSVVKVDAGSLPHLGIDFVQFDKEAVDAFVELRGVNSDSARFPQSNGITMRRITRVQDVTDLLRFS